MQKFARIFRGLPDPRAPNALHELLDVLVIALAAVLCGAKCATDMALFGRSKEKLLRQFLRLEHGIPSHDTFSRVFRALEPDRKSTRLNSSHQIISYAVFCLKKKKIR